VPRRWVIYKTLAEASQVPPEWHGWLHYMIDTPPSEETYVARPWQKPHRMNLTGTPEAYRPPGSILSTGKRPAATGDYQPWQPS
jgi:NADH:ubiquinone oxidoreductase subunit